MHDCNICEKKLFCSLDMEVHKSWLKQLRLSNIRKFLLVSSNKGGLGLSTFSNLLACGLKKHAYKIGLIEMSYNGNFLKHLYEKKLDEMTLSSKGIEALNTRFNYLYTSPSLFLDNNLNFINWDTETNFKVIKNLILNTNWEGIDIMILDIPFYMLETAKFLRSYLNDKLSDSIIILDSKNLEEKYYNSNFIDYVRGFTDIVSVVSSPSGVPRENPEYLKCFDFKSLSFLNDLYLKKFLPIASFDKILKENSKVIKEISELCTRIF